MLIIQYSLWSFIFFIFTVYCYFYLLYGKFQMRTQTLCYSTVFFFSKFNFCVPLRNQYHSVCLTLILFFIFKPSILIETKHQCKRSVSEKLGHTVQQKVAKINPCLFHLGLREINERTSCSSCDNLLSCRWS